MLGLMEERIEHKLQGTARIADTLTLFQRLEQRSDERVDARAYLRARLIDVLVGDWDRHISQWRWARFDRDGERIWQPIPRDRDQAFSRFDGVVPSVAEYYTKQIAGFGSTYPPIVYKRISEVSSEKNVRRNAGALALSPPCSSRE